uniref:Uncharacterized protein n=1 Tax=Avena sativa TaxID=4498 RepID=A0ACD5XS43_AVESA
MPGPLSSLAPIILFPAGGAPAAGRPPDLSPTLTMPLLQLQCSPRLLLCRQCFSPHRPFPSAAFPPNGRLSTAIRAEPELQPPPPPPISAEEPPDDGGEGPVELRAPTLFSVDDNPTTLQVATSVLLTGAISVFLFRSLRRRARRAKELRVRSGGMERPKNLSEEALQALRMVSTSPVETDKPPSPVQALLGGIAAGVISLFLYKFATTIEASLNRQTISDNFSVSSVHHTSHLLYYIKIKQKHTKKNTKSPMTHPPDQLNDLTDLFCTT